MVKRKKNLKKLEIIKKKRYLKNDQSYRYTYFTIPYVPIKKRRFDSSDQLFYSLIYNVEVDNLQCQQHCKEICECGINITTLLIMCQKLLSTNN